MTLTASFDVAKSGLSVSAGQTAVASRSIARAGDAGASRKIVSTITLPGAGVRLSSVTRAADASLFDKILIALSADGAKSALLAGLNKLNQLSGDVDDEASPAALAGRLRDALQTYSDAPGDAIRGQAAVTAAKDLASALNSSAEGVQGVREEADFKIAQSVKSLNTALSRFGEINTAIVKGTQAGADVTDELDQRDSLLKDIARDIGVRTVTHAGNDMAIYTDSGVTLFATTPRAVTFASTAIYTATTVGAPVYIDGVPVTQSGAPMQAESGALVGLIALRDGVAVTYQNQLDEIARGLIELFAESDVSVTPTGPDAPGLFTYAGAPAMPAPGVITIGLASQIAVAARVDPAQGGDVARLRDGGISNPGNPAYVSNASGAAGYSERLQGFIDAFSESQPFDSGAQNLSEASVLDFAASSTAWLHDARKTANSDAEFRGARLQRATEAHSNETGVNLDDEMARLLELERSYQASAKLLTSIDGMYGALFQAIG